MPERGKIKAVAREVKEAIGRLIANAKVIEVPLDVDPDFHQLDYSVSLVPTKENYEIEPECEQIKPGVTVQPAVTDNLINGELVEVGIDLADVDAVEHPIIKNDPDCVEFETGIASDSVIDIGDLVIDSEAVDYQLDPVNSPDLVEVAEPRITSTKPVVPELGLSTVKLNGIVSMRKLPITIQPVQWSSLDKKQILDAWTQLKDRATMKFGGDPGIDLEMTAMFRNIDFSVVKNASFDKKNRTMKVFVREPDIRRRVKPTSYAIIVGLLRSTGEVLQVAVKLVGC